MGILSNLFGWGSKKKESQEETHSEVEEFISLIGIYNQAYIISQVGITDIKKFPEFAMYKRLMRIPTVGGKVGIAEKAHIRKMMITQYGMNESFFKEMDYSIRKNCKNIRNVQSYLLQFSNFTNDLLTHLYTEHQWKIQGSILINKLLHSTITSLVDKLMTKNNWKGFETNQTVARIRTTAATLGFSKEWMVEFTYQILRQSKKKKK